MPMSPHTVRSDPATRDGETHLISSAPHPSDTVAMGEAPTVPAAQTERDRVGLTQAWRRGVPRFKLGWLLSVLIVALCLVAWQAVIWIEHLEPWLLPGPLAVLSAFGQPSVQSLILDNLPVTLAEALIGFGASVVIGAGLAVAMFVSRVLRDALYPLVIASQAVPTIAIGAVLVVALGYGLAPKVVVVVLYAFFAVTVSMYDSLQAQDPELVAVLRTLGASSWQILRTARLPAALPGLFTGARLAAAYSVSGAIYGEWVGSTGGLGYALQQAANQFQAATVLAIVVVMSALGVLAFAALALLEHICVPWARAARRKE
jgi:ABC-type nitrate/sulfonate/bicarbonate transport system permease component